MAYTEPVTLEFDSTVCSNTTSLRKATRDFVESIISILGDEWEAYEDTFAVSSSYFLGASYAFTGETFCTLKNKETSTVFCFFSDSSISTFCVLRLYKYSGNYFLSGGGNGNYTAGISLNNKKIRIAKHKSGLVIYCPAQTGNAVFYNVIKDAVYCINIASSSSNFAVCSSGNNTYSSAVLGTSYMNKFFAPNACWEKFTQYAGNQFYAFFEALETISYEPTGILFAVVGPTMQSGFAWRIIIMNGVHYLVFGNSASLTLQIAFCLG